MRKLRRGLIAVAAGTAIAAGLAVLGEWGGGLAGAAIAGAGIYLAPEIPERLARRHDTARSAREHLDRVSADPSAQAKLGRAGPAALLRPDRRVVQFIGLPELDELREWCDGEDQPQVLLLTGAGGTGKTRLALELARERQAHGWVCRVVRDGGEAEVVAAPRAVTAGPVLLVADYAETRLGLARMLRAATGDDAGRLKMLLVARSKGEWWDQVQASTDASVRALAASAAELLLPAAPAAGDLVRAAQPQASRQPVSPHGVHALEAVVHGHSLGWVGVEHERTGGPGVGCGSRQRREERITALFVQVQLEQVGSRRELLDAYSVFCGYRGEPVPYWVGSPVQSIR